MAELKCDYPLSCDRQTSTEMGIFLLPWGCDLQYINIRPFLMRLLD